jgi:hypothetical protein
MIRAEKYKPVELLRYLLSITVVKAYGGDYQHICK